MCASSELQFGALREVWRHARGREHCRGDPGRALSGGYAPDSVKAEGNSIVDELAEDGVPRCASLASSNLVPFGRVAARERQGALSRRAW